MPLSHSFSSKIKANHDALTDFVPCFLPAKCICFEFGLVHWIVCVLCDGPDNLDFVLGLSIKNGSNIQHFATNYYNNIITALINN